MQGGHDAPSSSSPPTAVLIPKDTDDEAAEAASGMTIQLLPDDAAAAAGPLRASQFAALFAPPQQGAVASPATATSAPAAAAAAASSSHHGTATSAPTLPSLAAAAATAARHSTSYDASRDRRTADTRQAEQRAPSSGSQGTSLSLSACVREHGQQRAHMSNIAASHGQALASCLPGLCVASVASVVFMAAVYYEQASTHNTSIPTSTLILRVSPHTTPINLVEVECKRFGKIKRISVLHENLHGSIELEVYFTRAHAAADAQRELTSDREFPSDTGSQRSMHPSFRVIEAYFTNVRAPSTPTLTCSLTHSLTPSLTHSLTHSLTRSLAHLLSRTDSCLLA